MTMPRSRAFTQVDVFSTVPYLGNPVAVIHDGTDLTDEQMQRLARWTNLSETTFVLPPTVPAADYRLGRRRCHRLHPRHHHPLTTPAPLVLRWRA